MKKKGYLPFTTAGIILLILSASIFGYYEWNRHQMKRKSINQSGSSQLSTSTISERTAVNDHVRRVLNDSLYNVGGSIENFETTESETKRIEQISERKLENEITTLSNQTNLNLGNSKSKLDFKIKEGENGRAIAHVEFPENTNVRRKTPDKSTIITLPLKNLKTKVTPRFFLLQNRMNEFGEDLNNIERRWKYFEYALAYSQAWLKGKLEFSEKRSKLLFQLALATHEINKFGSTDYQAIIRDLTSISLPNVELPTKIGPTSIKNPLNENTIQSLSQRIEKSIRLAKTSEKQLRKTENQIEKVAEFHPEKRLSKQLGKISELKEKEQNLENKFSKICKETESVYAFPRRRLEKSLNHIQEAKNLLKKSQSQFEKGLESIKSSKQSNQITKQLYEDFTQEEKPRGIAPQLEEGFNSVLDNLKFLEKRIYQVQKNLPKPADYEKKFPGGFQKKFSKKLRENKKVAKQLLSEAYGQAKKTFTDYENDFESNKNEIDELHTIILKEIKRQAKKPDQNWSKTFTQYPGPGEKNETSSKQKNIEKYVIFQNQGTIGGIEKVLSGTKNHLNRIKELDKDFEKERKELEEFEIDKALKKVLKNEDDFQSFPDLPRENVYGLSPPKPLKNDPNISVYHEIEVESVKFDRLDPLGLVNESAPPTPIYLWFIDTVIYWGLWDVKIEIKKPLVEKIFDYPNQTIPRPITKKSGQYVHKPLPYKQEFQKTDFEFKLLVLNLRNFSISS